MRLEQLRVKFLNSWRRVIVANQFYRNSIRAPFRHNFLHYQNFWRQVEWPSIQRSCTFIPSAAFQLHRKTLFDAICFFNPKQRKRGVLSQLETWMSWRQPRTERHSFIFFPLHSVLFILSLSTTFVVDAGLLSAIPAMLRDAIKDTPLTELHIWFVYINDSFSKFGAFSLVSKSRILTSFMRRKVDDHVCKTPPPLLLGEYCFLGSFSFCGTALVATYPVRNINGSLCVISGFRRGVHKICAVLGYYAAYSGNYLPTFRGNLSVPSSRVNKLNIWIFDSWKWDR